MGFRIHVNGTEEQLADFKERMHNAGYDMTVIAQSWWAEMMPHGEEFFLELLPVSAEQVKDIKTRLYDTVDPFIKLFVSISIDMNLGWIIC